MLELLTRTKILVVLVCSSMAAAQAILVVVALVVVVLPRPDPLHWQLPIGGTGASALNSSVSGLLLVVGA